MGKGNTSEEPKGLAKEEKVGSRVSHKQQERSLEGDGAVNSVELLRKEQPNPVRAQQQGQKTVKSSKTL